jgi:single-strand DNA-binding protein
MCLFLLFLIKNNFYYNKFIKTTIIERNRLWRLTMNNLVLLTGTIARINKVNASGRDILNVTVKTVTEENGHITTAFIPVQISIPNMVSRYEGLAVGTRVSIEGRFETFMSNNRKGYNVTQLTSFQPVDEGDMNHVVVWGRLTRDLEIATTKNGTDVASFSIANSRSYKTKSDEWKEVTSFIDVVAWNDVLKTLKGALRKGDAVWITGRLASRSYENKNHEKVYVTEIVADKITSGGSGKRNIVESTDGSSSTNTYQANTYQSAATPQNTQQAQTYTKPPQMPTSLPNSSPSMPSNEFMNIPDFADEDELPF